ncbi:hypothetical protein NPIL_78801 [Nephila pilipes]|uniref:Uncharacterized protein n=1 Tax=Nephila pilipes TaxID=299642 RepID=A0A8X6Q2Y8_NEPPI|nr:hypothetical protein NPIL_78801 [Nephila pilipes]
MIFAFVASSVELDKRTYASDSYARLVCRSAKGLRVHRVREHKVGIVKERTLGSYGRPFASQDEEVTTSPWNIPPTFDVDDLEELHHMQYMTAIWAAADCLHFNQSIHKASIKTYN